MHCPRCPAFPPHPPHYFVYPEKKKPGLVAFRTCHSRGSSSTLWSYAFTFQFFRVVRFSSLLLFIAPFCWQTKRSVISSQCCLFDFSVCVHHSICFLVVGFITGYSTSFFFRFSWKKVFARIDTTAVTLCTFTSAPSASDFFLLLGNRRGGGDIQTKFSEKKKEKRNLFSSNFFFFSSLMPSW